MIGAAGASDGDESWGAFRAPDDQWVTSAEAIYRAQLARERTVWMPWELWRHAVAPPFPPRAGLQLPREVSVVNDPRLSFRFCQPASGSAADSVPEAVSAGNARVTDQRRWQAERRAWREWLERGATWARERRLDGFLENVQDQFPILAEFKAGNDKNPFHALIQLVMYAAELAAPSKWQSATPLAATATAREVPADPADDAVAYPLAGPLVDVYIVLGNYQEQGPLQREMLKVTAAFCQRLMQDDGITSYLRRVACLNATWDPTTGLVCRKLFAYPE